MRLLREAGLVGYASDRLRESEQLPLAAVMSVRLSEKESPATKGGAQRILLSGMP